MTVAGFNFGTFKKEDAKLEKPPMVVASFTNSDPPDWVNRVKQNSFTAGSYFNGQGGGTGQALGSMNTTILKKKALGEAQ